MYRLATLLTTILMCGGAQAIDFDKQVAPILAAKCLSCHDGKNAKGKLNLRTRNGAFRGGDSGKVIVPGNAKKSLLWNRILDNEMPPRHPLSAKEKRLIRDWIQSGAKWGQPSIDPFRYSSASRAGYNWWSLQPLKRVSPPGGWSGNPIDYFIQTRLRKESLEASDRAGPRTLVRRLYFDLHGLPAPPEAIARFARDPSQSKWRKLVDELLASPHYGERWARHWLDVVRFGESHGFEYNVPRENAFHYRDWVIRALNRDLPYDQFVRMQIAGDIIKSSTLDGVSAAGFLVAGTHNTVLGKSAAMRATARHEELAEISAIVGQAFIGLTIHCARCHDHKFDPVSSREYYSFIALLDGVRHGERRVFSDAKPAKGKRSTVRVYTVLARTPGVMRFLQRGDVRTPGAAVNPGVLKSVRGSSQPSLGKKAPDDARRLQLAKWLTGRNNGPFHRVIVNRMWHYHFGAGIVTTPSDFGFNGARPSHPELLDFLGGYLRKSGYSLKELHRLIVTSRTYQQSSNPKRNRRGIAAGKIDQTNRLLWRQNARRVDAESLRDSMLAVAGVLNRQMYGRGFRDTKIVRVGSAHYYIAIDPVGPQFRRRTIYRWQMRGQRSSLLESFDCPDPSTTTAVRSVTTTASQALSQWNHSFVLRMSKHLAARVRKEVPGSMKDQIERMWQLTFGRRPDKKESQAAFALAKKHGLPLLSRVLFNANEWIWIE